MSKKDGSVSECEDVSFNRFWPKHAAGLLVIGLNGALVWKRLEAIRSPFASRSCIVSAFSSICFREMSFVVLSDSGSV